MIVDRMIFDSIKNSMENFPCVFLWGSPNIGKTIIVEKLGKYSFVFTLNNKHHLQRIKADTDGFFSRCYKTVVLEDVQQFPQVLHDLERLMQKTDFPCGSFLLTSNASPMLLNYNAGEGSGYISCVNVGGFQLAETWKRPRSRLCDYIISRQPEKFHTLKCLYTHSELLLSCLTGSYPEPALNRLNRSFCHQWYSKQLHSLMDQQIKGFRREPQASLEQILYQLAQLSANGLPVENLSPRFSARTLKCHMKILEGTGLWRTLPTAPTITQCSENRAFGLVRDSGLLCHMLKIGSVKELESHDLFPAIWRSFIWEELLRGFSDRLVPIKVYCNVETHDSILFLEGSFGTVLIGLQTDWSLHSHRHISCTLEAKVSSYKNDCYGILFSLGTRIRQLSEKLFEVPVGCL